MKIIFDIFRRKLSSYLESLGKIIGKNPLYFVIIPLIVSTVFGIGIIKMNYNRDYGYLFTSESSKTVKYKNIIESLYAMNTSYNYDAFRITKEMVGLVVIAVSTEESILTENALQELQTLNNIITNFSAICDNETIYYHNICAKNDGKCLQNPIFKLKPKIKDFENGKHKVKYPLDVDLFTYSYKRYILNLGGVTVDENKYIRSAKALRLFYPFDYDNVIMRNCMLKFEINILAMIKTLKFQHTSITALGKSMIDEEIEEFTEKLTPLTFVVFFIMVLFSTISCMSNSWVRSKPLLGIASCVSALLSVISSFGFLFYCGMNNTDTNVTLPYLILAIEIDDAYVLISAWRRTHVKNEVHERLGKTYKMAAVSVTITTTTNLLSFCIGIMIPFPVVRTFCIFASVCIFLNYVYQITFFGGWMAISGIREERNINPFTLQKVKDNEIQKLKSEDNEDPMAKLFKQKIGGYLCMKWVKLTVIFISIINLSIGIWGMKYVKDGMDIDNFLNHDSYVSSSVQQLNKYFTLYPFPIHIVIAPKEPLDYSNKIVQQSIENIIKTFESHPHTSEESITLSWLKYYKIFAHSPIARFSLNNYNLSDKQDFMEGLRNVFLNIPTAKQFRNDIIFNDNFTEIIASRFIIACKDFGNREIELQLLKDLQIISEKSELPVVFHSFPFPFLEHALLIRDIVLQLAWVLAILVIIIFFIFIPNLFCAICISMIIVMSLCETIGYMALWNVHLDIITVILLVLSSGFSINYPTHVSYAFALAKNKSQNERIKESLYEVGWPIMQGTISTILGVIILAFQSTYVFICFFKIVFLIAIETAFNAMFLLPVLLSFISNLWDRQGFCKNKINKRKHIMHK